MQTLHSHESAHQFAQLCQRIFFTLRGSLPASTLLERLENAIHTVASFMPKITLVIADKADFEKEDHGEFSGLNWSMKVNRLDLLKVLHDREAADFNKLCATIYHEARHAEQFFRMAQAIAAGKFKTTGARATDAILSNKDPWLRKKWLNGSDPSKNDTLEFIMDPTARNHAASQSRSFVTWVKATAPLEGMEHGWKEEVESWYGSLAGAKKDAFMSPTVAQEAATKVIFKVFYMNCPHEADAYRVQHLVERYLDKLIHRRIKPKQKSEESADSNSDGNSNSNEPVSIN